MQASDPESFSELLKAFLSDPTIRSLVKSASKGQRKRLQRRTSRVYDRYRQRISKAEKAGGCADRELVARVREVQDAISGAFRSGQFKRSKSKRQKRRGAPPTIYSGGLPGMGKRR